MDFAEARAHLIAGLRQEIKDERVLDAMARVPRELFVPPDSQPHAYEDRPLPIGLGQTISQPFIIALMTAALELKGEEKVLEIGTGSGYQAAILSRLCRRLITLERLEPLADRAREVLAALGHANVEVRLAGNLVGLPEEAPFGAILVTAGAPSVPRALIEQLSIGGRLVIPVGGRYEQDLLKITRTEKKEIVQSLGGCRFVPLIGPGGWDE
jgi:protein-L-isoaspartate(D-aspartate) O-methyltransferase